MRISFGIMACRIHFYMRGSKIFFKGWGVYRPNGQKTVWTFFLVLNLFYSLQRTSKGFITEKTILSKDQEGVQHFPGGEGGWGPTFSTGGGCKGEVRMLISIETHITCDFPGGGGAGGPPIPNPDPHSILGLFEM